MTHVSRSLLALMVVATLTTPVFAQSAQAPSPPHWRAYYLFDSTAMTASRTFDAVFERTRLGAQGGGFEATDLWRGVFARVAVSALEVSGSRVVVFGDEVIRLGLPLRLELRPLEIGGGWRLTRWAGGRVVPYGGAAFLRVTYDEQSDFADTGENTNVVLNGTAIFGGLEFRVAPWAIAGAEVQYRRIPNALGESGVAREFRESDLGGTTVRVLVGIRP